MREDVISMVTGIMAEHIPQLAHLRRDSFVSKWDHKKTEVIRLPAWPYNESRLQDVVKIAQEYQDLIEAVYKEADIAEENQKKVHVGGDLLTRERLSQALRLRIGNFRAEAFHLLGPVTFEYFHLMMNFLEKVVFRRLYNEHSDLDVGTMKAEINRISRNGVTPEVTKAYNADRDFFLSFYKAYVVEGLMEHLDLESLNSAPEDFPPPGSDSNVADQWVEKHIGSFVDKVIFPSWSGRARQEQVHAGT